MPILLGVRQNPQEPSPPQSAPDIGSLWGFLGDSHNFGYGDGTCHTPGHAFARIWQTRFSGSGPTNPYTNFGTSNIFQNGESGRTLTGTMGYYNDWSGRTTRTFLSIQESGSQGTGQSTASQFGDTLDDFFDAIFANTPSVKIVIETAFNFHRGVGEEFETANRDWTAYNTELKLRVSARGLPNQIFVCETDRDIKLLEAEIGQGNVWLQPNESNPYHYKSAGNLMIALGHFKALGINDITIADLADIGTDIVSSTWQQICLDIYNLN